MKGADFSVSIFRNYRTYFVMKIGVFSTYSNQVSRLSERLPSASPPKRPIGLGS